MSDAPGRGAGPEVGAQFAGHRIEAVIGRGGMGVVYRARNLALDRERALKLLAPSLSRDDRFRERFRRESRIAASLEHENVIPVHDAGEEAGHLFLAMRLVDGRDLRQLVEAEGPLDPSSATEVIAAVAAGLDAAHEAALIHRDVKPANVLVGDGDDAGRVFLTDFGISRTTRAGETVTATGEIVGTADFIAPEQIAGEAVDGRADVYALGGVLHYALTGEPPFPRDNELATLFAHANAPRPRPSAVRAGIPAAIDDVVARAMAVDPDARPASAGELAAELRRALTGERPVSAASQAGTSPIGAPQHDGPRRLAWIAAIAGIAAAVAAVVLVIAGGDDQPKEDDAGPAAAEPTAGEPITVGEGPSGLTVGELRVWVAAQDAGEVVGINPLTLAAGPRERVAGAKSVAAGHGSIWAVTKAEDSLYRLNPGEDLVPEVIPLGAGSDPSDVAVDERWVWVTLEGSDEVARIDPEVPGGDIRTEEATGAPRAVAVGDGSVWVVNIDSSTVSQIDPLDVERIGNAIPLDSGRPSDVAVGLGSVWVIDNFNGTLTRIDPGAGPEDPPRVVGDPTPGLIKPRGVKTGFGQVWVVNDDGTVVGFDALGAGPVGEPVEVGEHPADIAVGADAIWVANSGAGTVTRVDPGVP